MYSTVVWSRFGYLQSFTESEDHTESTVPGNKKTPGGAGTVTSLTPLAAAAEAAAVEVAAAAAAAAEKEAVAVAAAAEAAAAEVAAAAAAAAEKEVAAEKY